MATHKWHFEHNKDLRDQLSRLSPKDRLRIFQRLKELLEADNPKAIRGVKKLVDVPDDQWRIRQGNYRIIFTLKTEPITHENLNTMEHLK